MTTFFWDGLVEQAEPDTQEFVPDADIVTTGWSTAPLFSKIEELVADATVISATATGASPAIVGSPAETAISTADTSHVVNLPTGTTGNLLLAVMSKGSAGTTPSVNALAGWNELLDEAQVLGLYIAWRLADGTEGATTTFTLSSATRGAWVVYEISGQSSTQAPEIGVTATGSSVNPNPPSVAVTGGSKPVLAIGMFGMAGEQADDDTLVTTFPTNYTDGQAEKTCGTAGTNLGGMIGSAARQVTTATEDPGTFTAIDNAAWRAQTIIVHPAAAQTSVARISLGGGSIPYGDMGHAVKTVARVSSGAGTIRAALYEGASNRSGDMESPALTSTLSEYTLSMTEAAGAAITDYSDLELRIWGYSATGASATFEIDNIYLSTPEAVAAADHFGESSMALTVGVTTAGSRTRFGATASSYAFGFVTEGRRVGLGATSLTLTAGITTAGVATHLASSSMTNTFGFTTAGAKTTFGVVARNQTFSATTAGARLTFGAASQTLTLGVTTVGKLGAFGSTAVPIVFSAATNGQVGSGVSATFAFGITTAGAKTTFGVVSRAQTFTITTAAAKTTFGVVARSQVFSFNTAGVKTTFGTTTVPIVFSATTSGNVGAGLSVDLVFGATTAGSKTTFGDSTGTYAFGFTTQGRSAKAGQSSLTLAVTAVTAGTRATTGQVSMPLTFTFRSDGTPPLSLEDIVTGWIAGATVGHHGSSVTGRIRQPVGGGIE